MNKTGMFLSAFFLALTKFVLMPIIAAVLIIAGFFTEILATWIGCGFMAMYLLLCLVFAARVAAVADIASGEDDGE